VTALLYHACRFRANRETVRSVSLGELRRVLAGPAAPIDGAEPVPSCYVQLPALAIWAVLAEGPPEPVDGWFRTRSGDRLEVLAILGLRPGRGGFTAVEVAGPAPGLADREDSTELFAPIQAGTGAQAGLAAVKSDAELLELCWRVEDLG